MLKHVSTIVAAIVIYLLHHIGYRGESPEISSLLLDLVRLSIVTLLVRWIADVAWSAVQRRFRGWAHH
jgi:hypothetical protein